MTALAMLTNLILIIPLFFSQSPSQVISPLASGTVLGINTTSNQELSPNEQFESLIGQMIEKNPTQPQNQTPTTTADIFPKTFKGNIKILILGSTQTVQLENGANLITKLNEFYPNIKFDFVNYSSPNSDINYALAKTNDTFINNSALQSSVIFQEPDILLVDTFGYDQTIKQKTDLETHVQKLNNLINIVFSYNKSQNVFITNFTPSNESFAFLESDPNLQYGLATKTLQNIYDINSLIEQKNLPKIDITTTSPSNSITSDNFQLSKPAIETLEAKIIEYLINNQTIDKALETQKLY